MNHIIRQLREPLRTGAFRAIYQRGVRWSLIEEAYERWEAGAKAIPCIYGEREQKYAVDCKCDGCLCSLCFFFFDQALTRFEGGRVKGADL
jgi:hypothetical protein